MALVLACSLAASPLLSQEKALRYVDASAFPLYGKVAENTSGRYTRLPAEYESSVREALWWLGRQSAGLYLRFRSDSPEIHARWSPLFKTKMNHMTMTGMSGLDLYALSGGQWLFAGSGRPSSADTSVCRIVSGMDGLMREYMLYLPLYDGLKSLEIGVLEGSVIDAPLSASPRSDGRIVMYGTSILQGGCVSRPGMAFTAILSRRFDREVVNLGFSGNALLDLEIARWLAKVEEPLVYVLDEVPNASPEQIEERGEEFFRIIREAHPDVPVILVEEPYFPHSRFDRVSDSLVRVKNAAQRALYEKLKASGEKRLLYLESKGLIGCDGEATVDGVHFTDLGALRYSEALMPLLRKALRISKKRREN